LKLSLKRMKSTSIAPAYQLLILNACYFSSPPLPFTRNGWNLTCHAAIYKIMVSTLFTNILLIIMFLLVNNNSLTKLSSYFISDIVFRCKVENLGIYGNHTVGKMKNLLCWPILLLCWQNCTWIVIIIFQSS